MQISRFDTGDFVLHRVTLPGSARRFSAWYTAAGALVGAEGFDRLNRSAPATKRQRADLARIGPYYRHKGN